MRVIFAAAALAAVSATPAFGQSFNGGNVALVVGYDHGSFFDEGGSGVVYGIGAGYDFQTGGGAVFGIQLEATDATTEDCTFFCIEAGRDLYAGGRVGAVVDNKTLIYGLAGYSNGRVSDGTDHLNLDGIRAGLGVEHQPGNNWFFRFEGRYTNYEQSFERWQGVAGIGIRF
jgi:outer membrane immunogenic protein